MQLKNSKRLRNHIVIFTSDAVDAKVKQIRIKRWVASLLMMCFCIGVGFVVGYILYNEEHKNQIWESANESVMMMKELNQQLILQNKELKNEVAELDNQVALLSNTLNQKVKEEGDRKEQMIASQTPTTLPINGSATVEQKNEGDPMCLFKVAQGTLVVNTAEGVVVDVSTDEVYGNTITVDHQNGYVTVYKNPNQAMVQTGDYIYKGTTLFIVEEKEGILCYQVIQDGVFVDPMTMVEISG